MCCPTIGACLFPIVEKSDNCQAHHYISHESTFVPWTIPESYPQWQLHDFISAFDPLAINAVDQLFNSRRPGPSPHHLEE